jgi:hypothetical protein
VQGVCASSGGFRWGMSGSASKKVAGDVQTVNRAIKSMKLMRGSMAQDLQLARGSKHL